MRKVIFISILFFSCSSLFAQLFGRKDISIQIGYMNFHASSLNNTISTNNRISKVTEVDKHLVLGRLLSFDLGAGLGSIRNMDTRFESFDASNFFRIKSGFIFHLPQQHSPTNWSPKGFNPYVRTSYNLDIHDNYFKQVNGGRVTGSVRLGFGFVVKLKHSLGVLYEFSHNQKFGTDNRTFFQQNIGLVINMDQMLLKK